MMSTPKDIGCSYCGTKNFDGLRYCCNICSDCDLCGVCYYNRRESLQHSKSHSMRCISELILPQLNEYSHDLLNETEYLPILFDFCLQRFIKEDVCCYHVNTYHFKERFAEALKWTNRFTAKLSGSHLSGLLDNYFVEISDNELSVAGSDTDIMFEPDDTYVTDTDMESPSDIGFIETTEYPGFYYIKYNPKTKYHPTLQNLDIFEERHNKKYISSKKVTELLHQEFSKFGEAGPCLIEQHGPAISTTLPNGRQLLDFVFSFPMSTIPQSIRESWLNRPKQWPSDNVVQQISSSACHLVPKRWYRTSETEDEGDALSWRLSLSFAEMLLTNSWDAKQKDCYFLLKAFVQELAPEVLSSHHIKTFVFTYFETKNMEMQAKNRTDILLDMIQNLSADLKLKTMRNYFIPEIDILRLIPEEKYLNLAEKLDQFYQKTVEMIKQMKNNYQNFAHWFDLKLLSPDDYSKINVYTWHLKSLLFLALKSRNYIPLKRFEHIIELSNTYFPLFKTTDKICDVEDLLFTCLNIIITERLRKGLPECFDQQREQELHNKYDNNVAIWLKYRFIEPIAIIFNMTGFYDDAEIDNEVQCDDDDDEIEETQDDVNTDDFIIIPFLKPNGLGTDANDYTYIPLTKLRLQDALEFLISMLSGVLLYLPAYHNIQHLIDQFHTFGLKDELLSQAFYEEALNKCNAIFRLKWNLYAIERDDPVCVNITEKQKEDQQTHHDICYEQMKNLFDSAIKLSSTQMWKIKVHMSYTFYYLFGRYDEAIGILKTIVNDYNADEQQNDQYKLSTIEFTMASKKCPLLSYLYVKFKRTKDLIIPNVKFEPKNLVIPTIVLAYYTLFQSFRMINQWDNGKEYIDQFQEICTRLEDKFSDGYDVQIVKLLLASSYFCIASMHTAIGLAILCDEELMSLCGIQLLVCQTNVQGYLDHDMTLELPYALSECGGENEKIHIRPELVDQSPPTLVLRHGYDCYKMRSWLVNELTILDELEKWMSRLPASVFLGNECVRDQLPLIIDDASS